MNLLLLDTGDAADAHWDDGLRAGRELMARYAVQMTFETPNQREPLKSTHRLLGRAGSIRLLGGDGRLAVSAAGVSAESAADAAMTVVRMVNSHWPKSRGPLIMRAWTAHRERVLLGRRGGGTHWSSSRPFDDGGDADGSAGVREPRRPLPGPGSLHAAADLTVPGFPGSARAESISATDGSGLRVCLRPGRIVAPAGTSAYGCPASEIGDCRISVETLRRIFDHHFLPLAVIDPVRESTPG